MAMITGLCVVAAGLALGVSNTGAWAWFGSKLSKPVLSRKHLSKETLEKHAFCSAPGPRDYAAPLGDLPPITELPAKRKDSVHLPFGPKNLAVYTLSPSVVLVSGGLYGYGFYDRDFSQKSLTLDWKISAQLQALTGVGLVKGEIDEGTIEVGSFTDAQQPFIKLAVPKHVGFYRVDLQFSTKAGEALGSYSEYLRVMRPTIDVRLGINRRHFQHNQILAFRLENVGTARAGYGGGYWVARATPHSWEGVDQLNGRSFLDFYAFLEAGKAGRCTSFRIPRNLPRGLYRVSRVVGIPTNGHTVKGRRPSAEFRITDPPRS